MTTQITTEPRTNPAANRTPSGVDRTLLEWLALKTPAERLEILQNNVNAAIKARNGRRVR